MVNIQFIVQFIVTITTLFFCSSAVANLEVTDSIKSQTIQDIVKLADASTIVLVNIQDTILVPQSKMFRYYNNPNRAFIGNLVSAAQRVPSLNNALAVLLIRRKMTIVEEGWPDLITQLKNTGALVLGVYHTDISEYNLVGNYEELRVKQLYDLGVYFTNQVNNKEIIPLGNNDSKAKFYKGVLFSGKLSKAGSLIELMKVANISPRKVIFFDTTDYDVQKMQYELRIFDIDYYSVQYTAVMKPTTDQLDMDVMTLQQNMLINKHQWLEDDEAENLIAAAIAEQAAATTKSGTLQTQEPE